MTCWPRSKTLQNKFDDLAKKNSKRTSAAPKRVALSGLEHDQLRQRSAQAVTQLKRANWSTEMRFQTRFGWHIIKVRRHRPVEFPPLDQVRPQLEEMLRQQTPDRLPGNGATRPDLISLVRPRKHNADAGGFRPCGSCVRASAARPAGRPQLFIALILLPLITTRLFDHRLATTTTQQLFQRIFFVQHRCAPDSCPRRYDYLPASDAHAPLPTRHVLPPGFKLLCAALRLDASTRFFARWLGKVPVSTKVLPAVNCCGFWPSHRVDPLRLQLLDDVTVVLLGGEEAADGCRHHRARPTSGTDDSASSSASMMASMLPIPRVVTRGGFSPTQRMPSAYSRRFRPGSRALSMAATRLSADFAARGPGLRAPAGAGWLQVGQGFDPATVHPVVHQFLAPGLRCPAPCGWPRATKVCLALGAARTGRRAAYPMASSSSRSMARPRRPGRPWA